MNVCGYCKTRYTTRHRSYASTMRAVAKIMYVHTLRYMTTGPGLSRLHGQVPGGAGCCQSEDRGPLPSASETYCRTLPGDV